MANQYSKHPVCRMNFLGKKFNHWTIVRDDGFRRSGEHRWICRCDCGEVRSIDSVQLIRGISKSCGCYKKDHLRELFSKPDTEIRVNRVFCDYRNHARSRNLPFETSKEEFARMMDSECYYCGAVPGNSFIQHGRTLVYQGIDRLDNSKGYVSGNVVPCCEICNKMKKTMNHNEFLFHVLNIANRFEVKSPQTDVYSETCGGLEVL